MRVFIIVLLLIILGVAVWKGAERFGLIESPEEDTVSVTEEASREAADAPVAPALPSFDLVRVDAGGSTIIAGRASSEAQVRVYANGELLEETVADNRGDWVIYSETSFAEGPIEFSLEMTTLDGVTVRSEQTVIILVPARDGEAPRILRTTPGGATEVLQDPSQLVEGMGPLALDVIDYDDAGAVIFAGRAKPGATVQLFLNQQIIGQVQANDRGRWTLMPDGIIEPGVYSLLVVQLDDDGRPAFAIELPFERAEPSSIQIRDGRVIVQPGNSLWRIARSAYGEGIQYTIIYEANVDQIRDPDLIYPGQIFEVPKQEDADQ